MKLALIVKGFPQEIVAQESEDKKKARRYKVWGQWRSGSIHLLASKEVSVVLLSTDGRGRLQEREGCFRHKGIIFTPVISCSARISSLPDYSTGLPCAPQCRVYCT